MQYRKNEPKHLGLISHPSSLVTNMRLDLTEIAGTLGKHHHYKIDEPCSDFEDLRCVEPVKGDVDFTNTGSLILARGKFSTRIELDCARCLEKLTVPVEVTIEEQLPITDLQELAAGHHEVEITEEEIEPLFEDNKFDLTEFIRQAVLVEIPIRPLCDDACKGLCSACGTNLNEGPCDCPVDIESSPFSVLKELIEEEGSDE